MDTMTPPQAKSTARQLILVNLGCGALAHPAWVNVDVAPREPWIRQADFRRPLPFADASVDAVYHAHVLEHLDRAAGRRFLAENARILKPGGVLRVVVPDLQALCRQYLDALALARTGAAGGAELHEWSCLDLMDQMVRRTYGGEMLGFLNRLDLGDHPDIAKRMTLELLSVVAAQGTRRRRSYLRDWRHLTRRGVQRARKMAAYASVRALAGRDAAAAFKEGLFRTGGEVHLWMYDAYSLAQALYDAGLVTIAARDADASAIPDFASYELDMVGRRVRRPGSLFMEGVKPP